MARLLTMPSVNLQDNFLFLKTSLSGLNSSNQAGFFAALDISHTERGYESVTLTPVIDTTEQTIVDISGNGVLTHVLAPALAASGTMTIRVTIDGTQTAFVSITMTGVDPRFCLGDFRLFNPTSSHVSASVAGPLDQGYGLLPKGFFTSPNQTIQDRDIGMVFQSALKVTFQASANPETANTGKAAACYTTYIPRGYI